MIRVYVRDHRLHIQFCKEILGVFPRQMRIAWGRLVYSGAGQAPIEVDTEESMCTEIAEKGGGRRLSDTR